MNKRKIGETEYELPLRCAGALIVDANQEPVSEDGFLETIAEALNAYFKPIDIITHCPKCHEQHIDAPEPDNCKHCGFDVEFHAGAPYDIEGKQVCENFAPWDNPPHKKHRCKFCNHTYKPANVPTNGVAELMTD